MEIGDNFGQESEESKKNFWKIFEELTLLRFLPKSGKNQLKMENYPKIPIFFPFLHVRWLIISKFNQKIKFGFEKINL